MGERISAWGRLSAIASRRAPRERVAPIHPAPAPTRYRSIFISDVHLGTPGCRADALLAFLRSTTSDHLYLVGDIVDGWQLRRRWYWHQSHNDVIEEVLLKVREGTVVTYIPGNHDEDVRHFLGLAFGGIGIREDAIHVTSRGLRLWVTHGDLYDDAVLRARWIARLGTSLHSTALTLNRRINRLGGRLGFGYWPLSQVLTSKVRTAVSSIVGYENALAHEARRRGADGVVCGHVHKAEMRDIGGILYCNDGDWVESLTALVETDDGELRIVRGHDPAWVADAQACAS